MAIALSAEARSERNPRKLRRDGFVPAVVYGDDTHEQIQINNRDLKKALGTATRSSRFSITVGKSTYDAFLREVQYHPISDSVLHVDFYQPGKGRKVTLNVPLRLRGTPVGLKLGGNLFQIREFIPVRGQMETIPEIVEVDVTNMDVGSVLRLGDIQLEGVSLLLPLDSTLATVKLPRRVVEPVEEGEVAEGAEGEETPAEGEEGDAEKGGEGDDE